jgi:hypothetical protein
LCIIPVVTPMKKRNSSKRTKQGHREGKADTRTYCFPYPQNLEFWLRKHGL